MRLTGKTALITGATGGLGQAIARTLAAHDTRTVLTGRDTAVLAELAAELNGQVVTADITNDDDIAQLMRQAGPIDILIANAGVTAPGPLTHYTLDDIDTVLDVNLRAPMRMARLAVEQMTARGTGHLVFMSALGGRIAVPRMALYCATKHGLRGFAHAIRADLAPRGVGVSVICPIFVRDAGMVTRLPSPLPSYFPTCTAQQVADAVCQAIRDDTAEVVVAPWYVRQFTRLAGVSPAIPVQLHRLVRSARHAQAACDGLARRQTSHLL
ncbi:SDR family oxidoreductase [Actinomadura sp. KC06]|uniref:SDR family NAD(P)-dependent oxidoreductase n=1 Tax=Actinomadura sp. KC06 TaxID=2530369 RepID=UPI001404F97A|nr:SDR family oxidoreductase [Actinomadura sp. KC06]